jgi:hypothetical protein
MLESLVKTQNESITRLENEKQTATTEKSAQEAILDEQKRKLKQMQEETQSVQNLN